MPDIPGCRERFHWSFPDPSKFTGSDEEIMERVRELRDRIKERVAAWAAAAEKKDEKG